MPAASVPMVIDRGEDWTSDIIYTDSFDEPVEVTHPCRMSVKDSSGATVFTLETDPDIPDGEIPGINFSSDIGLLQLHMTSSATAAISPGLYQYDLFVTVDNGDMIAGPQIIRLLFGHVTINQRITVMT
jgi:hypothetical protein